MYIPLRLRTIASFIKPNEKVADVGADHGLLELFLVTRNTNNQVVAIENKIGPYEILKEKLIGIKNIRLSLSDGLEAVDRDVNTIVIAGMGGYNIVKILNDQSKKLSSIDKIIVDAHRDANEVRKTVINFKYKITKEKIIFENNTFYVIIVFKKTKQKQTYSEDEIEFGFELFKDPLWEEYKNHLITRYKRNIQKIKSSNPNDEKIAELKLLIERLKNYGKN